MTVFADSSAIVKLYADEAGHAAVREIDGPIIVSLLARVEVPAALWRKHRLGELAVEDVRLLVRAFEVDLLGSEDAEPRLVPIAPTDAVLADAARLVAVHGLRAYDGVQLASAIAARRYVAECSTLAAFDVELRGGAAAEGLDLLPTRLAAS